jgi:hypothetical protein
MSERENEELDEVTADPPDNQGGNELSLDSPEADEAPADPPDNQGGNG